MKTNFLSNYIFYNTLCYCSNYPDQFYIPVNTGSNMTLGINTDDLDDFIGGSLAHSMPGNLY